MSEPKMVLVVRKDLNMRKGKMCAQSSHSAVGAVVQLGHFLNNAIIEYDGSHEKWHLSNCLVIPLENECDDIWLTKRFKKITVSVNSEQELTDIYNKAVENGLNVKLILDEGLTEFGGVKTLTCLAIGPVYPEDVDPITGHLPLL